MASLTDFRGDSPDISPRGELMDMDMLLWTAEGEHAPNDTSELYLMVLCTIKQKTVGD